MKKRLLAGLLTLAMLFTLLPAGPVTAFAAGAEIYVSQEIETEQKRDGTQERPYTTLREAVSEAPDGATIYVMSDLEVTELAWVEKKNITITSYNGTWTLTRGEEFKTNSDRRSEYNPAMIEVAGTPDSMDSSLRLENIILDDAYRKEGEIFLPDGDTTYVQDAIVASYDGTATITLGANAELRNFGGMSAVRVTGGSKLIMESGSKITDTMEQVRTGDGDTYKGPAGAVWLQGGVLEMEAGSEITRLNGRAVYADQGKNGGSSIIMDGTISDITSNSQMLLSTDGVAVHLRGDSSMVMESNSVIENINEKGNSAVRLNDTSSLEMRNGSILRNTKMTGIDSGNDEEDKNKRKTLIIDGEITGIVGIDNKGNTPVHIRFTDFTLGANGTIHDNEVSYGALYIQKGSDATIYGSITNNHNSGTAGGIGVPGHGIIDQAARIILKPSAIISGNTAGKGAGIVLKYATLIMEGGEISGNTTTGNGGGILVYDGGQFVMQDGKISDNNAPTGSAIAYEASDCENYAAEVELNGGEVNGSLAILKSNFGKNDRYFKITNGVTLSDPAVYFETDSKTIEAEQTDLPIELGNASPDGITALTNAAKDKSYSSVKATFWAQTEDDTAITIGSLTNLDAEKDILLAAVPVGADGTPEAGAEVAFFAATINADGTVSAALPKTGENGYDFALVQPGDGPVTPIVPGSMEMTKTANVDAVENIGDEVTYTLSTNVPASLVNYLKPDEGIQMFSLAPPLWGGAFPVIFHDELPAGLDLDADSIVVKVNGEPIGEDLYTVRTDSEDISELSDDCTFEIEMDLVAILNEGYFEEEELDGEELPKIEIAYTAAYNGTAGTSLINTAWAEYANGDSNKAECTIQVLVIGGSDPAPSGGSDDSSILLPLLIGAAAVAVPIIVHHYKEKNTEVPEEVPVEEPVEEVAEETPAEVIEAEPVPKTGDTTHPVALALGGAAMLALGGALGRKRRDEEDDER